MSLAIVTASTEMSIEEATFWKQASVTICTTLETRVVVYTNDLVTLYQNHIDIPRLLRQNLVVCNTPLYKDNITARKCQSSPLNLAVAEKDQLLLTDCQG
jgi:tRNA1(Val) A37 N6-methylase TrmN6